MMVVLEESVLQNQIASLEAEVAAETTQIQNLRSRLSVIDGQNPDDLAQDAASDWTTQSLIQFHLGQVDQLTKRIQSLRKLLKK